MSHIWKYVAFTMMMYVGIYIMNIHESMSALDITSGNDVTNIKGMMSVLEIVKHLWIKCR